MRILIGSPIHISKDHCVEQWIENVAKLLEKYPADLFLVDSSPDLSYIEKVKDYLRKYGIDNYKIEHFEINQEQPEAERLGRSREIIRKEILAKGYGAWFNWECDYILPPDALGKLITIMKIGKYAMVSHIPSAKEISLEPDNYFGIDLIKKAPLARYGFLVGYPDMPDIWHGTGLWFKKRLVRDGGKLVGLNIEDCAHLNKYRKKDGLRLNLGCGNKLKDGYINIDIQEPCDLKHDLRDPLPLKDNSVDEIFSEGNVIALFTRAEWRKLKKEISRVLKPSGKLEIIFLDFEYILKAFLKSKNRQRWNWWLNTIFSGQENSFDLSKNGFTPDKLISDLKKESMEKFSVERLPEQEYIRLVSFKKTLLLIIAISVFIPRVIWADLSYIITDFTPEEDSPPLGFLNSISKRKEKHYNSSYEDTHWHTNT